MEIIKRSDRAAVDRVTATLREAGASVWFDAWELNPGDSIAERVERGVQASDLSLVFLSPASINSHWVAKEFSRALSREMNDRAISVVPVLLEDCQIPTSLSDRLYLDLRSGRSAGVQRFLGQLALAPALDPCNSTRELSNGWSTAC